MHVHKQIHLRPVEIGRSPEILDIPEAHAREVLPEALPVYRSTETCAKFRGHEPYDDGAVLAFRLGRSYFNLTIEMDPMQPMSTNCLRRSKLRWDGFLAEGIETLESHPGDEMRWELRDDTRWERAIYRSAYQMCVLDEGSSKVFIFPFGDSKPGPAIST